MPTSENGKAHMPIKTALARALAVKAEVEDADLKQLLDKLSIAKLSAKQKARIWTNVAGKYEVPSSVGQQLIHLACVDPVCKESLLFADLFLTVNAIGFILKELHICQQRWSIYGLFAWR